MNEKRLMSEIKKLCKDGHTDALLYLCRNYGEERKAAKASGLAVTFSKFVSAWPRLIRSATCLRFSKPAARKSSAAVAPKSSKTVLDVFIAATSARRYSSEPSGNSSKSAAARRYVSRRFFKMPFSFMV